MAASKPQALGMVREIDTIPKLRLRLPPGRVGHSERSRGIWPTIVRGFPFQTRFLRYMMLRTTPVGMTERGIAFFLDAQRVAASWRYRLSGWGWFVFSYVISRNIILFPTLHACGSGLYAKRYTLHANPYFTSKIRTSRANSAIFPDFL